jgi:ParB-like chromosome segregation protein Spo0J
VALVDLTGEVVVIPLADLRYGPKVRKEVDLDHLARLMEVLDECPPILVRAANNEVLDGNHRWGAAQRLNRPGIRAVVVDCDDVEAFELAVSANGSHGKPLSLAEKKASAAHMVATSSASDSHVAKVCGLSRPTVAALRPVQPAEVNRLDKRKGADNKHRPADPVAGREAASAYLDEQPDAPLRDVAKAAGVSPSTAGDVKKRKEAGDDPVPAGLRAVPPLPETTDVSVGDVIITFPIKGRWKLDPACQATNQGREFGRWMDRNLPDRDRSLAITGSCPAALTRGAVIAARAAAKHWNDVADAIERRGLTAVEDAK